MQGIRKRYSKSICNAFAYIYDTVWLYKCLSSWLDLELSGEPAEHALRCIISDQGTMDIF